MLITVPGPPAARSPRRMSFTADRLLLFGATGDLAQRMLLPSLAALDADKLLPEGLEIIGTAREALAPELLRAAKERMGHDAAVTKWVDKALEKITDPVVESMFEGMLGSFGPGAGEL